MIFLLNLVLNNEVKKHLGVIIEMRSSVFIQNLIMLIQGGVVSFSELDEFSDEFKETMSHFIG